MFDSPFSISSILGLPSKNSTDVAGATLPHSRSQQDRHSYKIPYGSDYGTANKTLIQPPKRKVTTTSSSSSSSRKLATADDKKTKRFRSSFSTEQLRTMEDTFRHRPYLSTAQVEELAGELGQCVLFCFMCCSVFCVVLFSVLFCFLCCSVFCVVLFSVLFCFLCCSVSCVVLFPVLYCVVLCCSVLFCVVLFSVLFCVVLCCSVFCVVLLTFFL